MIQLRLREEPDPCIKNGNWILSDPPLDWMIQLRLTLVIYYTIHFVNLNV